MDFKITGTLFIFLFFVGLFGPIRGNIEDFDQFKSNDERRDFVQLVIQQIWRVYTTLAWGQETIHPVAPSTHMDDPQSGETIFAALSTLWVANLKDDFKDAKDWIKDELNISDAILADKYKSHQLYTYIGPLLSAYALSKDQFFLDKAIEFAHIDSKYDPTGLDEVVRHGLIEYSFLSDLTGNSSYAEKIKVFQTKLWKNVQNRTEEYYLNGYPYEAEVRRSIQANGTFTNNTEQLQKYRQILDSALESGLITRFANWTTYHNRPFYDEMLYTHCGLGAELTRANRFWNANATHDELTDVEKENIYRGEHLAEEITQFCYEMARRTPTHLPAYKFAFNNKTHEIDYLYPRFELAPELAESYLALWRKTKNPKYREQAWQLVAAIYSYARFKQGAYGSVNNVWRIPTLLDDYQPIRALSGTFKYLYLIFSDDDKLPTDSWVFNADGHPFPICGQHELYPESLCKKQNSASTSTTTTESTFYHRHTDA